MSKEGYLRAARRRGSSLLGVIPWLRNPASCKRFAFSAGVNVFAVRLKQVKYTVAAITAVAVSAAAPAISGFSDQILVKYLKKLMT